MAAEHLTTLRIARALGALAMLVVGGVHLEQYTAAYFSVIPTIGPLFLLNFLVATIVGLVLAVPIARSARPIRLLLDSLAALTGIGVSVGAFAGLLISEHTPLFGFMEHGYRVEIVIALAAEAVATLSLAVFVLGALRWAGRLRRGTPIGTGPTATSRGPRPTEA
jgi:hypothetical protein